MTAVAPTPTWRLSDPHVQRLLAFIKKRGQVTLDEVVQFDRTHGRRLFDWNDKTAAEDRRREQARLFMNRFRAVFDGMRVRAFIHIDEDPDADIEQSAYVTVEEIAEHPGMRAQVVGDITRRMKNLASELRMWRLTPDEQSALFVRLAEAMAGRERRPAAAADAPVQETETHG
jgi:hypothetical protein